MGARKILPILRVFLALISSQDILFTIVVLLESMRTSHKLLTSAETKSFSIQSLT